MEVTSTGQTDTEIINRVLKGDQSAFALLVETYKNYVFTLVLERRRRDGCGDTSILNLPD